ncbi:MAG: hypothetical protein ACR2IU_00855 [Candidatus Nanopelagicaceae bacterium]|jgi:hypothetical protein
MHLFTSVFNRITQEDGSLPGEPLGTFKGLLYFVGLPTLLFIAITVVVLFSTVDRKSKGSSLTRIE